LDSGQSAEPDHRYAAEREKWDALAGAAVVERLPADEDFYALADRDPLLVGVSTFVGDIRGLDVLEYGCGRGAISVRLAKSGARVTAFDISPKSIEVARQHAAMEGLDERTAFHVAPAEDLPFGDESFDLVFGKAVLHHLDVAKAQPELRRIMRPGAKAVFSEPLGMNPLLNFARDWLPYRKKTPRGSDVPLGYDAISAWCAGFSQSFHEEVQLFSMLERAFGFGVKIPNLRTLDRVVLTRFPAARRFCRYAVIGLVK
jgi:2-polyprenyl-3-methyl-5-hydroxy-6-metoxy-1,4-benzoquinol methylase